MKTELWLWRSLFIRSNWHAILQEEQAHKTPSLPARPQDLCHMLSQDLPVLACSPPSLVPTILWGFTSPEVTLRQHWTYLNPALLENNGSQAIPPILWSSERWLAVNYHYSSWLTENSVVTILQSLLRLTQMTVQIPILLSYTRPFCLHLPRLSLCQKPHQTQIHLLSLF